MAKYLELSNILVSYDPDSRVFRMTSKDPKLDKRPFQVTLPTNSFHSSSTVDTLFELFEGEGLIEGNTFPEIASPDYGALFGDGTFNPKTTVFLGEDVNGKPIPAVLDTSAVSARSSYSHRDLIVAPHTFITARAGGGKTTLLRTVLKHAEYFSDCIDPWVITPSASNGPWELGAGVRPDRLFTDRWTFYDALGDLCRIVDQRAGSYSEQKAIFVLIDDFRTFMFPNDELNVRLRDRVKHISSRGRSSGVYLFAAGMPSPKGTDQNHMMHDYSRHVYLSIEERQSRVFIDALHSLDMNISSRDLNKTGRGIVSLAGNATPIQIYAPSE